ncbi:MAG TPA: RidA family protein [Cyclobacteriaceae bacterium]|nr:RidA family protein [Cyclobacteriaceae bacterium]
MASKSILSADAPEPIGPYSQGILAGNTLYVSGQIATDRSKGVLVLENVKSETTQVMKNLEYVLKAAGFDFSHVVKCTIFLKNMGDFPQVNEVYGSYFNVNPPARETVEVARLPKDVNVEISCIAVR